MAFYLTDSERQQYANGLLIPATEIVDMSLAFAVSVTDIDAKLVTATDLDEVTLNNYTTAGMTYEWVGDTKVDIILDQDKYASPAIDKADDFRSFLDASAKATEKIARAVAKERTKYVFAQMASGTTNVNDIAGTALDLTNVLEWLSGMQTKLDDLEAPSENRSIVVTNAVASLIARAAGAQLNSDAIGTEGARAGFVGNLFGFDIYKTIAGNLPAATTGVFAIASVMGSTVLGTGFNEMRVTEDARFFADLIQMRIQYGAKVVQPKFVVKSDISVS